MREWRVGREVWSCSLGVVEEGLMGVGGWEGIKKYGMVVMVDWRLLVGFLIFDGI